MPGVTRNYFASAGLLEGFGVIIRMYYDAWDISAMNGPCNTPH
jgi:hypothetical protein